MEIKGKVHCFFEQSGTFKNEFKKLGYDAYDYDIQNNFNETDYVIDLFKEIENAYVCRGGVFDNMNQDDFIIAFFPCIYFSAVSQLNFSLNCINYRNLNDKQKIDEILKRADNRLKYYKLLLKFCGICLDKKIRMVFENPYNEQTYLKANFIKPPDIIDKNRMLRGDYFVKPTAYWFFNCEPTYGESYQNDKKQKYHMKSKSAIRAGLCSEERSMISPDYARNFICDFILGKKQNLLQQKLF